MDRPYDLLAALDALAKAQLVARRRGIRLTVRPEPELRVLIEQAGLSDVLGVEMGRQPEGGEVLRPDEVVQPGDPPA